MRFQDIGIIIAQKPFRESFKLISLFTKNHGLYNSVVRGSSRKSGSIYSEGNVVDFIWQARLHDQLGNAKCDLIRSYSGLLITNKVKLYAFNSITSLIKVAFYEREPHNNFFPIFENYLLNTSKEFSLSDYIKLELEILNESGYGLQLEQCAITKQDYDLQFVSPKSGRAVSLEAGLPYRDKLLALPQFLLNSSPPASALEKQQAFDLTSYFFNRYLFRNHQQTIARRMFSEYIISST